MVPSLDPVCHLEPASVLQPLWRDPYLLSCHLFDPGVLVLWLRACCLLDPLPCRQLVLQERRLSLQ